MFSGHPPMGSEAVKQLTPRRILATAPRVLKRPGGRSASRSSIRRVRGPSHDPRVESTISNALRTIAAPSAHQIGLLFGHTVPRQHQVPDRVDSMNVDPTDRRRVELALAIASTS